MTSKDIFVVYISSETGLKNWTPTSSIEKILKIWIFWWCDQSCIFVPESLDLMTSRVLERSRL